VSHSAGKFTVPVLRVVQPTEREGYMIVARDLLQAVEALSILPPNVPPRGCALISAHALECALKAFLWHKGKKKEIREQKVQHDLIALWHIAYKEGLSIPKDPPDWVTTLSSGHGPNFYFRYQKGQGGTIVYGGSTPALIPMRDALKNLIEMVGLAVKA
jgi:hypothetical protein